MSKQKVFIVTKVHEEHGQDLQTQYAVVARSKKAAMELVLEEENIVIDEREATIDTSEGSEVVDK